MAVRLKYAGIDAQTVDNANDLAASHRAAAARGERVHHRELHVAAGVQGRAGRSRGRRRRSRDCRGRGARAARFWNPRRRCAPAGEDAANGQNPVVIAHLFPDLLNLYGDGGNVRVLQQRLAWRGIPVEIRRVNHGDAIDLSGVDLIMMGGSPTASRS